MDVIYEQSLIYFQLKFIFRKHKWTIIDFLAPNYIKLIPKRQYFETARRIPSDKQKNNSFPSKVSQKVCNCILHRQFNNSQIVLDSMLILKIDSKSKKISLDHHAFDCINSLILEVILEMFPVPAFRISFIFYFSFIGITLPILYANSLYSFILLFHKFNFVGSKVCLL